MGTNLSAVGNLSIKDTEYRLRDRKTNQKNLSANVIWSVTPAFVFNSALTSSNTFDRVVTSSAATGAVLQDLSIDTQKAEAGVKYFKALTRGLVATTAANGAVFKHQETSLDQDGIEGYVNGSIRYATEVPEILGHSIGHRVRVLGRGYLGESAVSALSGATKNEGLGRDADSLSAAVEYAFTDSANIELRYRQGNMVNRYMDLPRGVYLDQQFDQERIQETQYATGESIVLDAFTPLVGQAALRLTTEHTVTADSFAVEKSRFRKTTLDLVRGVVDYTFKRGTTVSANLERREMINDYGPQSLAGFDEKRQSLRLSAAHQFTKTLDATLQAGTSIVQTFYQAGDVNPRDRDQLDQGASLRINSRYFRKFDLGVYMSVSQTKFVNISASLSQDNRRETTYDLRPEITYRFNDRLSVKQGYGVNIEFTEFTYTANDNFLDRNFSFANTIDYRLTDRLNTKVYYSLRLHDRGSYLTPPEGGERLLDITQEDRIDQMNISFNFRINTHLSISGKNEYSRRRDRFVASGRETIFTDGGIEFGVNGQYELFGAPDRNLKFNLKKVNRYGRFSDPRQEDYWDMSSSLSFAF